MKGLNHLQLIRYLPVLGLIFLPGTVMAAEKPQIADVHLHYNWDQQSETSPEDAIRILKKNNVVFGVVMGTPPELALELSQLSKQERGTKGWLIPIFSPYLTPEHRMDWFADNNVLTEARAGLKSGQYYGIGEVHLIAGLGPRLSNPVLTGLIDLAIEFDVPFLVHIATSSYKYFLPLCKKYSKARFLLAHAGGLLDDKNISALMQACKNIWVEFSSRDAFRYIYSPIVDDKGELLPGWLALIKRYPKRFMIGSDPVWPVDNRHQWDTPDTGWLKLGEYLAFHRTWLSYLPDKLANRIRVENAMELFRYQK